MPAERLAHHAEPPVVAGLEPQPDLDLVARPCRQVGLRRGLGVGAIVLVHQVAEDVEAGLYVPGQVPELLEHAGRQEDGALDQVTLPDRLARDAERVLVAVLRLAELLAKALPEWSVG